MAVVINGTTGLSGVSTVNLANGSVTQNILANGVAGTGPSFSVWQSAAQTITLGALTKLTLNVEEWDTANCYDNTTNYRFTPNVAGYYIFTGRVQFATSATQVYLALFKNSVLAKDFANNLSNQLVASGSAMIYMNGTTDYAELYGYTGVTQGVQNATSSVTYFQGFLARAA